MKIYKDHLVAYIDFLGFQDFIRDKTSKKVEEIIPFLHQIKNCEQDFKILEQKPISTIQPNIFFFSDSIILSFPLDSLLPIPSWMLTQSIQKFIMQIVVEALKFGLLVRGALTVGKFYHHEGVVIGEALNRAHQLETNVAIYPRIVIDEAVFERGLIASSLEKDSPICFRTWLNDLDGIKYLNYLSNYGLFEAFGNQGIDKEPITRWTQESFERINKNIQTLKQKGNIKVLQKWQWFERYFVNSIISLRETLPILIDEATLKKLYDKKTISEK